MRRSNSLSNVGYAGRNIPSKAPPSSASKRSSSLERQYGMAGVRGRLSFTTPIGKSTAAVRPSTSAQRMQNLQRARSSFFKYFGAGDAPKKDPRPVSNRAYMADCTRNLIQFLSEHNYPGKINQKLLVTPMTKDVLHIFEFLYRFLDPKFTLRSHHEEIVPKILKTLGYPYTISKSAMYNLGSPHTWPAILAAIMWLKNLVQYAEVAVPHIENMMYRAVDDEQECDSKLQWDYISACYEIYMNDEDFFDNAKAELKEAMYQRISEIGDLNEMQRIYDRLKNELSALEDSPDRVASLKDRISEQQCTAQLAKNHTEELQMSNIKMQNELSEMEELEAKLIAEYEALEADAKQKQVLLETQDIMPADVERIHKRRRELEDAITQEQEAVANLDQQIWDAEMKIAKTQQVVQEKCQQYNNMALLLKLIPATADDANTCDYELKDAFSQESDVNSRIKPGLLHLKKACTDTLFAAKDELLRVTEQYDQLCEEVSDKTVECDDLHRQLQNLDKQLELIHSQRQQEVEECKHNTKHLQSKVSSLKNQLKTQETSLHDQHAELERMEKKIQEMKMEERQFDEFLVKLMKRINEHKEKMKGTLLLLDKDDDSD